MQCWRFSQPYFWGFGFCWMILSLSERCQMLRRRCVSSKRREPSAWSFTVKVRRCHETSRTIRSMIQRHIRRNANLYVCCNHVQSTHRWITTILKKVRKHEPSVYTSSGLYIFWWNMHIIYLTESSQKHLSCIF